MFHEVVAGLPPWLLAGLALGVAGTVLVALAFLGAERLFPGERSHDRNGRGTRDRTRRQSRTRGGSHNRTQSGEARRRAEFREYLTAIDESYVEDHPVDGQRVAFYLPQRGVAITFDPRVYYRIDDSGVRAVLAEHEMPGSLLGERLPFETPDLDFDDGVDPARAAFAELGVPAGASFEEIKRAYRRKLKEVHPDQGGDEDDFKRVREAYTIAKEHAE